MVNGQALSRLDLLLSTEVKIGLESLDMMGKSHIILGLGQGMINLFIADYFTIIQVSYLTTDDLMPTWTLFTGYGSIF